MKISIIGPPGAGKSTQSRKLTDASGLNWVNVGNLLRRNKDVETGFGTPREYMERGELVPKKVVNELVERSLEDTRAYVLDGYPLTRSQAKFLAEITELDFVFHLDVSNTAALRRVTSRVVCPQCNDISTEDTETPEQDRRCPECGGSLRRRADDSYRTGRKRLRRYRRDIDPALTFLDEKFETHEIDGEADADEVFQRIRTAIKSGMHVTPVGADR